ncbi:MAG: hypothetical protein FWH17_04685 [Oscillospiraceae bacterium]|nr:hypothetical protein [Oscillospiraceae bacterium]
MWIVYALLAALFAFMILGEAVDVKTIIGGLLITAGTIMLDISCCLKKS